MNTVIRSIRTSLTRDSTAGPLPRSGTFLPIHSFEFRRRTSSWRKRRKKTKKAKKSSRGRKDRARVAGGQDYEVRYVAKKTKKSTKQVKKAVKRAGPSRKKIVNLLGDY
jgi:hypothetical protein